MSEYKGGRSDKVDKHFYHELEKGPDAFVDPSF